MKNSLLLLIGLAFFLWCFYFFWNNPAEHKGYGIEIGQTRIRVDVADTPEKRAQGLSGRAELKDGRGMLFVFPEIKRQGFWMRDMNFAIDIIWINEAREIVGIENSVSPSTYPEIFYSPEPVKYVIEVPAGFSKKHSIDIGERVSLD